MTSKIEKLNLPLILAPAGNKDSFLAALAAGADAVYCGLKQFSARMEAPNFSLDEMASLVQLAHDRKTEVYITFNSLLKPADIESAGTFLDQLNRWVRPDALIIQDLSLIRLARQIGFKGKLHLSTLANVSFPAALDLIHQEFGSEINRVVLPRELNIDEIKQTADACPNELDLEVFVHGALCYGISGRCYWSSYMGGKSGIRGRCVQPCRRFYTQKKETKRFFSCQDLSLDVLVKVLLSIPKIRVWKIEGRKKGPHYVYYTVSAYKMLRDHAGDPQMKKAALGMLEQALGRPGTHYHFLPQRPQNPINTEDQTGSGRLIARMKGGGAQPFIIPHEELLPGDLLRVGYEDAPGHTVFRAVKYVPKKGRLYINRKFRKTPPKNTPVFLIDRREKALQDLLIDLDKELNTFKTQKVGTSRFRADMSQKRPISFAQLDLPVWRFPEPGFSDSPFGLWLSSDLDLEALQIDVAAVWWWLPPVIWPSEEDRWTSLIHDLLKKGARVFVLNAPWQPALFPQINRKLSFWAGPFCNIANGWAIDVLAAMGFDGVIVSPELGGQDASGLPEQSRLPLGIVLSGNWPLSISRVRPDDLKPEFGFASPKGEQAWLHQHGSEYWVYPNWKLDLSNKKEMLQASGYSLFVFLEEPLPRQIHLKQRKGLWNWDIDLS